jgi:starvation-inducible DNA-binding protein
MESINVGLSEQQRTGVVDTLNRLLADEHVLYVKTRNYHWNVIGSRFHSLHEMFEEQYTELAELIDEVAENVRQFGGFAKGTMGEFLKLARLKEHADSVPDQDTMLRNLADDHETIIRNLRKDIEAAENEYKAVDAADFLTSVVEKHNKMAWMLRSTISSAERQSKADRRSSDELVGSRR